jgi:diaminohydroxyphosphoribosylaminopyrimidine deaminase/5-amino-6-(5-phosphoribosylamino)uracil reductase
LREAGVAVTEGVLADEAAALNRAFHRWITRRRPWVIAKLAVGLDGRYSRPPGEPPGITSAAAQRDGHRLRLRADAILVGAETVRRDDPRLTVRGVPGAARKAQPWRIVLSRSGRLPAGARVFTDPSRERTRVMSGPLRGILEQLGRESVTCVLIEGGGQVVESALRAGLVDEAVFYVAPTWVGGGTPVFDYLKWFDAFREARSVVRVGRDWRLAGVRSPRVRTSG